MSCSRCCDHMKVEGRVTIALPEVATVCNGSQLELNCTINGSGLEWRIIPEQNHSQLSVITHIPTKTKSFEYGDSTITFTIISHPMELTLHMTVISPVTNILNGTEVKCTDLEDQESSSTVISVVNNQDFESIMVRTISKDFNRDHIEVALEWVPDNSLHTYHVNVTPQPAFSMRLKRNSIRLKVEYNVLYHVSIVTVSPCGQTVIMNEIYYISYYDMQGGHTSAATTSIIMTNSVPDSGISITVIAAATGSSGFLLVITLVIVFIICMALFAKIKGARLILDGHNSNANDTVGTEHNYVHNDPIKVATSGLVYAEVSHKQPTRQRPSDLLELDDTRVEYAQLKNNQLQPANTCNPSWTESQLSNDSSLCVNLDNLLIQLQPQVTPKWYEFGVVIGIEKEILDYFATKCSPEDCMVEMLDHWLQIRNRDEDQLTWKQVARALKAINLQQLASDIESVYKTGKLPVQVDISNFQGAGHSATVLVPPKKATRNETLLENAVGNVF